MSDLAKLKADRVQECMTLINAALAEMDGEKLKAYMQDHPAVRYLVTRIITLGKGSFIVDDELMTAVEGAFLELSVEGAAG